MGALKAQVKSRLGVIFPVGSRRRRLASNLKWTIKTRLSGDHHLSYARWIKRVEPLTFTSRPLIHGQKITLMVPAYNTKPHYIRPLIQSVINQTYLDWELLVLDGSTEAKSRDFIRELCGLDGRIKYMDLTDNHGISGNTNFGIEAAQTEYIGFLDHDDVLSPRALSEVMQAIKDHPKADLLYTDEDMLSDRGHKRSLPFFKPDWSPDLLLAVNYMAHFVVVRRKLALKVGKLRSDYDGAQDYDFMLRLLDHKPTVVHVPKILYHWRMAAGSTAGDINQKSYADTTGQAALRNYLERNNIAAEVISDKGRSTNYRLRYKLQHKPKISIIIPFKDKVELLKTSVGSILRQSTYDNYEIIVISNDSKDPATFAYLDSLKSNKKIKQLKYDEPFNYSAINNYGRKQASGEVLVFLNNDTKVLSPDWLEELAAVALRPEIGAVGPMLLYPDKTIQHAGVILGMTGMAGHIYRNLKPGAYTFARLADWPRNYLAVTGACLVMEAKKFDQVGGFDEKFIICGSDITLCLKAYEKGYRNVYWPYVELIHYESKSVGSYDKAPIGDYERSLKTYGPYLDYGDPYFNINLDLESEVPHLRKDPYVKKA